MSDLHDASPDLENTRGLIKSTLNFPVVGIGASAGGLQALLRFFEKMPAANGMAFVIILHLSPEHESNVAAILVKAASVPKSLGEYNLERNGVAAMAMS